MALSPHGREESRTISRALSKNKTKNSCNNKDTMVVYQLRGHSSNNDTPVWTRLKCGNVNVAIVSGRGEGRGSLCGVRGAGVHIGIGRGWRKRAMTLRKAGEMEFWKAVYLAAIQAENIDGAPAEWGDDAVEELRERMPKEYDPPLMP